MSYQRAITDPDVAKALAHPLRMRLLALLEDKTASPTELADITGASLPRVSYHVRRLASAGLIELVRTKQRRGAVEHYYRAVHQALVPAAPWGPLPAVVTTAMAGAALAQAHDEVNAAVQDGAFDRRGAQLSCVPITLDERGWEQLAGRMAALTEEIQEISAACEARVQGNGARSGSGTGGEAVAILMLFERSAGAPTGAGAELALAGAAASGSAAAAGASARPRAKRKSRAR